MSKHPNMLGHIFNVQQIKVKKTKQRVFSPSKTLQNIVKTDPRFDELSDERGMDQGYWLYCSPGYINTFLETHCIHEHTVKEVLVQLHCVVPCSAETCPEWNDKENLCNFTGGKAEGGDDE